MTDEQASHRHAERASHRSVQYSYGLGGGGQGGLRQAPTGGITGCQQQGGKDVPEKADSLFPIPGGLPRRQFSEGHN